MAKKPEGKAKKPTADTSAINWTNSRRRVADLIPAIYNPRQISEVQAKELRKSLERFGLADPIVLNFDGKIIGGHQRVSIMLDLGITECDVRVPDRKLTGREEKELNLRLNKNSGDWDWNKLMELDPDILKDAGFDNDEIDKLFNPVVKDTGGEVTDVQFQAGTGEGAHAPTVCPSCGYRLDGSAV